MKIRTYIATQILASWYTNNTILQAVKISAEARGITEMGLAIHNANEIIEACGDDPDSKVFGDD